MLSRDYGQRLRMRFLHTLVLAIAASAPAAESLNDLTGPWQLFVDDYLVETRSGLTRNYHAFEKYAGNPVLQATKTWEGTNVYLYGTVLPQEMGNGYRMWYHVYNKSEGVHRNCYATSTDGLNWTKPSLGIITYNGSTANNIHTTRLGPISILHTPFNVDPNRRYTHMAYDSSGYCGAWSSDGLHWTNVPTNPLVSGGDVSHTLWDFFQNKYLGYIKVPGYSGGLRRRAVGLSQTTDFSAWPAPSLIMEPDAFDDRWAAPDSVQRTHFYGFCPFAYETMYIGFLWIFRATDNDGYNEGPIFVELASSRDGVHWTREEGDRPPILPLGPAGAWDDSMVFTSTHPLKEGNTLRLYYGGFDDTHAQVNNWHGKIGLATLRKDGFASLDAGAAEGVLTTRRLGGAAGPLHVNYRAAGGSLKVEILDENGQVIPGYGLDECSALQGDSVEQAVTWSGGNELPMSAGPIRLRFVLQNAGLYSFNAGPSVHVDEGPLFTRQPTDRTVVLGGTATFTVQAVGEAPVNYQWQKNNENLTDGGRYSGSGTPALTVSQVDYQDVGLFRCVATDAYGSTLSEAAQLRPAMWTLTGVGMIPDATNSTINGLSSDGTVAAGTSGGVPIIWSTTHGLRSLGLPPASAISTAVAVASRQGTVIAAIDTNKTPTRSYKWEGSLTGTGNFTLLSNLSGYREWIVRALGTNGTSNTWFAGSSMNTGDGNGREPCRLDEFTNYPRLINPMPTGGHDHADFHAVADNGICAGQFQYGGTAPAGGSRNALKWDGGAACVALNTLMGSPSVSYEAVARAISRDSLVIGGGSHYPGGGSLFRPVLWKNSITPTAIPFIPGGDNDNDGEVLALNGDGTLAGGYTRRGITGASEAFIWDAVNQTRSLQQVLTSDFGLDLTGWTLQEVRAISADGLVLAGAGLHDGQTEGWVVYVGHTLVPLRSDFNNDGDVDAADLAILKACFSGNRIPVQATPDCLRADLDDDGDVDLSDFGMFQMCLTDANIPPASSCLE